MTKANGRKPLNIELSDEEREALERLRVRGGLRSHADTVRLLIETVDGDLEISFFGGRAGTPNSDLRVVTPADFTAVAAALRTMTVDDVRPSEKPGSRLKKR